MRGWLRVEVASETGSVIHAGDSQLKVDKKFPEVQPKDYVGVIIPCMGQMEGAVPLGAVKIVRDAHKMNIRVAAQQSGVEIIGAAGLLKGRTFAIGEGWQNSSSYVKDGNFRSIGVVRDGNILTSGTCPFLAQANGLKDGTDELIHHFCRYA